MSIHLTEEERHLPEGHQDTRGIMISDLAGVFLKRLIASGMGFGFDAPMRAKRTEDLTGIEGAILQGRNGRDPIDDFIRGLLNAIRRLDDSADGENLLGKREGHLIPRNRQAPYLVCLDPIGLRG